MWCIIIYLQKNWITLATRCTLLKLVLRENEAFLAWSGTGAKILFKLFENLYTDSVLAKNSNNDFHFGFQILGFWITGFWRSESEIFFGDWHRVVSYTNRFVASRWIRIYMAPTIWFPKKFKVIQSKLKILKVFWKKWFFACFCVLVLWFSIDI